MYTSKDVEKAAEFIRENAAKFAEAKKNRIYLSEFRKSKKALLINTAPSSCKTVVEKESYAYAHDEYREVLEGYGAAVEIEETLLWKKVAALAIIEIWRTQQATNRAIDDSHR